MPPDLNSHATAESSGTLHPTKGKLAEDQGGVAALPAHVVALKDTLLDFNRFVGLEATTLVLCDEFLFGEDEGNAIPLSAYKAEGLKESQRAWERELLEDARRLAEGARKFGSSLAQDADWQKLFRRVVTKRKNAAPPFNSHMPNTIEYTESDGWDSVSEPSQSSHRDHKPDLCFGFPIYNTEGRKIEGFRNSPLFPFLKNFTSDLLSELAKKGLRCTPVSSSHTKMAETKENRAGLQSLTICFPWCIMQQVARAEDSEDLEFEMFRRVSVAASPALSMFERLARFADERQDGQHIQPVITFTSVGSNVTLALAYSEIVDDKYTDHKILSVWEGCISKIWDAIQFCRILDNMLYWAKHVLWHEVSHYIDQWKLHYCPENPNIHSRLKEDPETAELVHRIQDRLSFLDILPSPNMIELVKQAVILQEVVKLDVQKTESVQYVPSPNAEEGPMESSMVVPSQPSFDKAIMRGSLEGLEKEWERKYPESGEGESQKEEDERDSSHGDKIKSNFDGPQSKSTLEPISPQKHASMATKSPVSYERHKKADSTAPAIDFSFSAVSSKPPTRKHVSWQIKSHTGGYTLRYTARRIRGPDDEPMFAVSRWMEHQHFRRIGEAGISNNTLREKDFGLGNCSRTISSAPPSLFTATRFEPRIDVKPWLDMMNRDIPSRPRVPSIGLRYKDSEPDPERPRKSPSGALRDDFAGNFPPSDAVKRQAPDDQGYWPSSVKFASYLSSSSRSEPAVRETFSEPILPKKKIPWKDRFILVRLPPPPPQKDPDLLPEDRRSGM